MSTIKMCSDEVVTDFTPPCETAPNQLKKLGLTKKQIDKLIENGFIDVTYEGVEYVVTINASAKFVR